MQQLSNIQDETVLYKDVVVVGNGPGGIILSYMLNGNWPYYNGSTHPGDEMFTARLNFILNEPDDRRDRDVVEIEHQSTPRNKQNDKHIKSDCEIQTEIKKTREDHSVINSNFTNKSLLKCSREQLEILATGVDGRGTCKPLPLMLDSLQHPCVDAGLNLPGILTWKSFEHNPQHRVVDHVVLGKGPPGGAWQYMDPNVLTISLSRWMSLPGMDLQKWARLVKPERFSQTAILLRDSHLSSPGPNNNMLDAMRRIPVGVVAAYYRDYVNMQGLAKYFKSGRTVTSVKPILEPKDPDDPYNWIVKGYENQSGRRFRYKCKKVVLATGTTNTSNHLGIPGEETQSSWVTHDLNDLESRLDRLAGKCEKCMAMRESQGLSRVDPVLVVGAGLSAADAIIAARCRGIPVIHAFRGTAHADDTKLSANVHERLQSLPISMYPEYHKVFEMMTDGRNHRLYKALPSYRLSDLGVKSNDFNKTKERTVTLQSPSGQFITFRVSIVAILIGSRPDLSYLGNYTNKLGKELDSLINSRTNPIEIDDITYEVIQSPRKGLYAIGPLVGDNFVRFILGGAFGVSAHILRTLDTE